MTYALDKTVEQAMATALTVVRQAALAIKDIDTELHEHANTVHGIKDLLLAHLLIMIFFLRTCERSRVTITSIKNLLFVNKNWVICVKSPPQQRPLHERPCMIELPQLYQHESFFVLTIPWATKALLRCWRDYKNTIPGHVFVAALVNT